MSLADKEFIETCNKILNEGFSSEGERVRPKWEDGTSAHTIGAFGIINRFPLNEEFPMLTLRGTYWKSALDELLWIWQKKSNNIHDLGSHIWDKWADESGSIGKAYGYQLGSKHRCKDVTTEGLKKAFPNYSFEERLFDDLAKADKTLRLDHTYNWIKSGAKVKIFVSDKGRVAGVFDTTTWYVDQVDKVIYDLINQPFSRRIMTTLWSPDDLDDMHLQPCAWNVTFMVSKKGDKRVLNMMLQQRSQDMLAAWAFNTAQYAMLQHMLAQIAGMEVGEMLHCDVNCHIYDRHVPLVKELIQREPKPAPKFWMNPEVKDFYAFTKDDIRFDDYEVAGPQMKFEIAE